jgi:hypothetical protein
MPTLTLRKYGLYLNNLRHLPVLEIVLNYCLIYKLTISLLQTTLDVVHQLILLLKLLTWKLGMKDKKIPNKLPVQ